MTELLDLTPEQYKFERKLNKLRDKIRARKLELNIVTDHSPDGHFYVRDGQKYKSVTSKLTVLKDQSLANWKMNKALEYIYQNFPLMTVDNILDYLDKARLFPQNEFLSAGSIGTQVHFWREEWFKLLIHGGYENTQEKDINPTLPAPVVSSCRAIKQFVRDTNYQPIACELYLADHDLKLGGCLDDVGFVNGKLSLVDLKTSNIGDKNSYFHQVALYAYMFWRLYKIRVEKFYILHTSKTDGTYKLIEIHDMPQLIKESKLTLKLTNALERLSESKKKERVVI